MSEPGHTSLVRDGGEPLVASLPAEPDNRGRQAYTLRALLGPLGFDPRPTNADAGSPVELYWPDRPDRRLALDPGRLREAFEALSGLREANVPRDRLGRVASAALGIDCSRPALSEWAVELADSLAPLNPAWNRPRRRLTVHLTHDVDVVNPRNPMTLAGMLVRWVRGLAHPGRPRPQDSKLTHWLANAGQFVETYQAVMDFERQAGARATYFFCSGPYSFRRYGSRTGQGRRLRGLIELAESFDHRVGLHGCVYSLDRGDYARQMQFIARHASGPVTWHRNHYLVWDAARSPSALARAGISVDSTCGFHDANGFRSHLAWPYELWDIPGDAPSGVVEIPLIFMDACHDLDDEQTWAELYDLLARAEAVGGQVAVLFHADLFLGQPERIERYRKWVAFLADRGALAAE